MCSLPSGIIGLSLTKKSSIELSTTYVSLKIAKAFFIQMSPEIFCFSNTFWYICNSKRYGSFSGFCISRGGKANTVCPCAFIKLFPNIWANGWALNSPITRFFISSCFSKTNICVNLIKPSSKVNPSMLILILSTTPFISSSIENGTIIWGISFCISTNLLCAISAFCGSPLSLYSLIPFW